MRYPTQHKAKTHERLLKKASLEIRRRGVQGTGIASLMAKLGMTHGGFYSHFDSKNALVAEATISMFEEHANIALAAVETAPEGQRLRTLINLYLSKEHRDSPEVCPMASLGGEMSRQSPAVRKAFIRGMEERVRQMARFVPGRDERERRDSARLLISALAGAMMIARTITDLEASDRFLEQAREFYLSAFESAPRSKGGVA
jgi:TetR/AcrR family transcriptional repressor of nem operon